MLNINQLKLAVLCGLSISLFCFGERHAKADTINFDDINASAGPQQVAFDHYRPQGLLVFGAGSFGGHPHVIQSNSATTPPNFLFSEMPSNSSSRELLAFFVLPGTNTPAATTFISFDVITTGEVQAAQYQLYIFGQGGRILNGVNGAIGSGNAHVTFSTTFNEIVGIELYFSNFNFVTNRTYDGLIGIDSLNYHTLGEPIPEPTTLLLLGSGLIGVVVRSRRGRATHRKD